MIPTTLQRYVLRETLRVALLSAVALTGIIFVGMGVSLVNKGLSIVQLRDIVPYIFLYSLPYALPMAMLVASVFVFGRLSGDNELTAVRSSGINLNHLIFPLLVAALLVSGGTFWLNHYLLPWSLGQRKALEERLVGQVIQYVGTVQSSYRIDRYTIYVGRLNPRDKVWENVAVIEFADDEYPSRIMMASRASCRVDEEADAARLYLEDVVVMEPRLGETLAEQPALHFKRMVHTLRLNSEKRAVSNRPKYDQLPALLAKIRSLEQEAVAVRRRAGDGAALEHPRTARHLAERRRDEAYRAWGRRKQYQDDRERAVQEATEGVEKLQADLNEKTATHAAAQTAHDDLLRKIDDLHPELRALERELVELLESGGDPARFLEREQELQALRAEVAARERQLAEAEMRLKKTATELNAVAAETTRRRSALDEAQGAYDTLMAEAGAGERAYHEASAQLADVKTLFELLRARTELHFRSAGALSTLVFVLIGIPLGVLSRRGGVLMAFVVSFFAVLILYYPLMIIGKMLSMDGYIAPWTAQWMPNMAVGVIGLGLMIWCVRR